MLITLLFLLLRNGSLPVTEAYPILVMPSTSTSSANSVTGTPSPVAITSVSSRRRGMTTLNAHHHRQNDTPSFLTRRNIMDHAKTAIILATAAASSWPTNAFAGTISTTTSTSSSSSNKEETIETGLLESRVLENLLSPPTYGMEASDVYYPDYFTGVWQVKSYATSIQAPCGIVLFGGNATYTKAMEEINAPPLMYKARFIQTTTTTTTTNDGSSIADREYNVKEIANAAMGYNSVLEVLLSPSSTLVSTSSPSSSSSFIPSPNKISVILAPKGSNQIVQADLITLARRYETIHPLEFHASEVVRQIVAPVKNSNNNNTGKSSPISSITQSAGVLLKEIETISLYKAERNDQTGMVDKITCVQRSATFLLPSQQDPMAYKMWEATRGRPIDVRFYNVEYTKV